MSIVVNKEITVKEIIIKGEEECKNIKTFLDLAEATLELKESDCTELDQYLLTFVRKVKREWE